MKLTEKLTIINELENKIAKKKSDDQEIFNLVVKVAKLVTSSDRGSLFLYDKSARQLISEVAEGLSSKIYVDIGQGIVGRSAEMQEIINEHDVDTTKDFNSDVDVGSGYITRSTLTIPIIGGNDELFGVFQVLNKESGNYDEQDEELLLSVANLASIYIKKFS